MLDDRLIARVAELFYIDGISQYEIARKFNFTKSKTCRIIKEAKNRKIIQFHITNYDERRIDIEKKLEKKFNLREAIIYVNQENEEYDENLISNGIGKLGAQYFERILVNNLNIALTWGRTLYYIIKNINVKKKFNVNIFATLGGINTGDPETLNNNLVQLLYEKIGGTPYQIFLPLFLKDFIQKDLLSKEAQKVIENVAKIDYYFAGAGMISKDSHMYNPEGVFNDKFIKSLNEKNICGEIGLNFYNIEGKFLDSGLENKCINLNIDKIKKIKNIIISAFGKDKVIPLVGLLRSKTAHILISDLNTAKKLVEYD